MSIGAWLIIGAVVIVLYVWYVTIVKRRNRVAEALAGIDVQLQQRHDLIPNLLAIARHFMEHERSLLTEITDLRVKAHQQIGRRTSRRSARSSRRRRASASRWDGC